MDSRRSSAVYHPDGGNSAPEPLAEICDADPADYVAEPLEDVVATYVTQMMLGTQS